MSDNPIFAVIRSRQSVRRFSSKPLPERLLGEVLELANRAPSAFNLQPWHFILVRNHDLKRLMHFIALEQDQIAEAPAVLVVLSDPLCWDKPLDQVLAQSVEQGALTERAAGEIRKTVRLKFRTGVFGLVGLLKRVATPLKRLGTPTPRTSTSFEETDAYMREQTMYSVATFLLGCESIGLATCVVDQFDHDRLRKLLGVPGRMSVAALVAVGYPMEGDSIPISVRTPIQEKLSLDLFPNKVSLIGKRK